MAVSDVSAEARAPGMAPETTSDEVERGADAAESRGRAFSGAGVTAGTALIAGLLIITRDQPIGTLGALGIIVSALALLVTAAAVREWPWARGWTGPRSPADAIAGPMAWLAVVFAGIVILTNFVPVIVPAWSQEQVFAVAIVGFIGLSILGWGPGVRVAWPAGLRLSSLTVLGSIAALVLIGVFAILLFVMRTDAMVADDREWARLVELRSTVQALAFAAAGALLGVIVQRQAALGDARHREELLVEAEDRLAEARAQADERDLQLDALLAGATSAIRLLTPDAPNALERADPTAVAAMPTRPSATALRQARLTLLEALRAAER
ncbi:MAG TPA: hypothetical protein VHQ42_00895 [Candidatus Limnocylindria bacterium]|nr:hypothetical protein [Candidatus Limnocylindria bacterium]